MTNDTKLIGKLLITRPDDFRLLWVGQTKDHGNPDNAKQRFHEILADHTTDNEQIDRIYKKSGLWENRR